MRNAAPAGTAAPDHPRWRHRPATFGATIAIAIAVACSATGGTADRRAPLDVIAYYVGDGTDLDRDAVSRLSHLIYSFLHLQGDRLAFDDPESEAAFARLVALKDDHPDLKVLVALGGWGGCETCSAVFATDEGRRGFATSVRDLLATHGADGLDLDWEYPAIAGFPEHPFGPADRANFTALVSTLREVLGDQVELSFAGGGFRAFIDQAIEWDRVMPLVDRVNLMTYDLVHGFSAVTGHHTPLYPSTQQPEATDAAVQALIERGVPASKIVIGAAFYARVWEDVDDEHHGLFQPGRFKESVGYNALDAYWAQHPGFTPHWDDTSQARHYYNVDARLFLTLDDPESIRLKTRYAIEQNLGGIMFWHLTADAPDYDLLGTIDAARAEDVP